MTTLAVLLVIAILIERLRLTRAGVNRWFLQWFGSLYRPEERTHMSGVVWMMAGVLVARALLSPAPLAATAVVYLILGDAAASLAGKAAGGPHWPGSAKRISGSLACFLICVLAGATLLRPEYGWAGVLAGAAAATALEAAPLRVDDNFLIPAGSAAALWLLF